MSETSRDLDDSVRTPFPPRDEKPINCSPSFLAAQYARYFRKTAADFRDLPPDSPPNWPLVTTKLHLVEQCGNWIIEAFKFGLFPELPDLRRLVEFHTSPMPENGPDRNATYVRCPKNLFFDVCGMNQIRAMPTGEGKLSLECNDDGSPKLSGGLLVRLSPGHQHLPHKEYAPATCEALADLIEVTESERSALAHHRSGNRSAEEPLERNQDEPSRSANGADAMSQIHTSADRYLADLKAERTAAEETERRESERWIPLNRLRDAWYDVRIYDGPSHRAWSKLIVNLGRVLVADAWLEKLEVATNDNPAGKYALEILKAASTGSEETVLELLKRAEGRGNDTNAVRQWLRRCLFDAVERAECAVEDQSGRGQAEKASADPDQPGAGVSKSDPAGMTWREAAERMNRLRVQGEPWTSQHNIAEQFGCSSGTINKAIRNTPELQNWANRQPAAAPKAQSLNEVVTDCKAQNRESDPADDAAIREFVENADSETKAWFLALSREDQLEFLNDPDKHPKILGRKP